MTGDILIEKARQIWHQIPQYQGQPIPEFSVGLLDGLLVLKSAIKSSNRIGMEKHLLFLNLQQKK